MQINWYGQTCFRIISQRNRDGSVNILIDPLIKESGLRSPKLEADILLFTSFDNEKTIPGCKTGGSCTINSGEHFLITGPGEYDIKRVYIEGIISQIQGEHTIYTIEAEGMKICHLGKLSQKELTSNQLERIGDVDILMIPIGGAGALDAKEAIKIMAQIEPKVIIPMYYKVPNLKIKLEGTDKFLKALGVKKLEPLPKLSIKKKDISKEEVKIIVLKP